MRITIEELLSGIDCECGKRHSCPVRHVFIGEGAANRLFSETAGFERVLAVADENTYNAARPYLSDDFLGKAMFRIFPGTSVLIPNEEAIETVTEDAEDADLLVAIGSGVIQDLCKYVSFQKKIPYIVLATAPSMDGYASDGAAMILGGMKVTVKAALPLAIIGDTGILSTAPMDMIRSGYGDIIGKYSALNDWRLSTFLTGEYYCGFIHDLTYQMIRKTEAAAEGLLRKDKESIGILMEALIVVGIMMSYAGTSRPASGSEHHLSHFFEITGILDNTPYLAHGIDVGFSAIVTAQVRERLLSLDRPVIRMFDEAYWEKELARVYGNVAPGVENLQRECGWHWNERLKGSYQRNWGPIRQILKEMPSDAVIREKIEKIGLKTEDFVAMYGQRKISDAVLYGMELKDRFTCLRLYNDLEAQG